MAKDKPNILLIFTDQHRTDTLSCYDPDSICQTPHLDAIAEQSTVFHEAYTVCAVCSPARASLQTGLYPHRHGVETNIYNTGCKIHELPDTEYLMSRRLLEAGYSAGYTGKWHIGEGGSEALKNSKGLRKFMATDHSGMPTNLGFEGDDFPGHGGGGYHYPQFKEYLEKNNLSFDVANRDNYGGGHTTTGEVTSPLESTNEYFLVEQAIHYIDEFRKRDKPFCFQLHFWGPHEPFFAPTEFLDLYRDVAIPESPNFSDDGSGKPTFHDRFRRSDQPWSFWENSLRYYYGFMTSIDAQIGRLIEYLKEHELYDNTAILFSADHGDSQGCHGGIENKSYHMYEETIRIPLFIKPALPDCTRRDVNAFVNTCDLYASILDIAGVAPEIYNEQDGRSLIPFTEGESPENWRESVVAEGLSCTGVLCTHRMIRQGDWKYVFYASGTDELYNLKEDPWEKTNLIDDPAYARDLKKLQQGLFQCMAETNDPIRGDFHRMRLG